MPVTRMVNNLQVTLGKINTYPVVGLNIPSPGATVHLVVPSNTLKGVIIQGVASQAQNLLEIQDVSNNILLSVSPVGSLLVRGIVTSGSSAIPLTDATGKILASSLNTVDVAHGGLGATSLTGNGMLIANAAGTSVSAVVGTSVGQVPTWNGTTFVPTPQAGGGNVSTGAGVSATSTAGNIVKWLGANVATDSSITEYVSGGSTLIGINKAVPLGKLHIQTAVTTNPTLVLQRMASQTGDLLTLLAEDGTTKILSVASTGYIGLGTAATTTALFTVNGSVATNGSNLLGMNASTFVLSPADTYEARFMQISGSVTRRTGATNPNAYGLYIDTIVGTGSGVVTTGYGLFVNEPTVGSNNIAAYFGGQVQIGATYSANVMLSVAGSVPLVTSTGSHGLYINPTLNPDNTYASFSERIGGIVNVTGTNTTVSYGLAIDQLTKTGSGTVTTAYGLFVQKPTIGTNNYAANFGGSVGIGAANSVGVQSNALFSLNGTYAGSTSAIGINENLTLRPIAANSAKFISISGIIDTGTAATGDSYGIFHDNITNIGTGSVPHYYSLYLSPSVVGSINYGAYIGGNVGINKTNPDSASLYSVAQNANTSAIIAQGVGGQTANIQEWWNVPSGSPVLQARVTPSGTFFLSPTNPALTLMVIRNVASATQNAFDVQSSIGASQLSVGTTGNVGINQVSPSSLLHITGNASPTFSSPNLLTVQNNAGVSYLTVGALGNIGIGQIPVQNMALVISTNVPISLGNDSYGIYSGLSIAPDNGRIGYSFYTNTTVNVDTGINATEAYGMYNFINKNGAGTVGRAYGASFVVPVFGTISNIGLLVDGGIGGGTNSVNLVVKGSAPTASGDLVQYIPSSGGSSGNINKYGNYGMGSLNTTKRTRVIVSGTLDGIAETSNTTSLYLTSSHTTNPGSYSAGLSINEAVSVASGTNSNYYSILVNPTTKSGSGTYANTYGLYVSSSSFGTNNYAAIFMNGNVGVGTAVPAYNLDVTGTAHITGKTVVNTTINSGDVNWPMMVITNNNANAPVLRIIGASGQNGNLLDFYGTGTYFDYLGGLHLSATTVSPLSIQTTGTSGSQINLFSLFPNLTETGGNAVTIIANQPNVTITGIATNVYGYFSQPSITSGLSGNGYYGLYIDTVYGGGVTRKYGAYFADPVGIGTSAPTAKLDVLGTVRALEGGVAPTSGEGVEVISTAGNGYVISYNRSTNAYRPLSLNGSKIIFAGGNVGIGTSAPGRALDVNGDANIGGTLYSTFATTSNTLSAANLSVAAYSAIGTTALNGAIALSVGGIYSYGVYTNTVPIVTQGNSAYGVYATMTPNIPAGNNASQIVALAAALANPTGTGTVNSTMAILANAVGYGTINYAMYAQGSVAVTGTLTKGAGTFLIDHPLAATEKDLRHGFVEAPQYDLMYRGTAVLSNGKVDVDIDEYWHMTPGTFAALNQNVQYFVTNDTGWEPVRVINREDGKFTIICKDETSSDIVAWMVIGERADAFVKHSSTLNTDDNGHLIVEEDKRELTEELRQFALSEEGEIPILSDGIRGYHRHPEVFGLPRHNGEGFREQHGLPRTLVDEN